MSSRFTLYWSSLDKYEHCPQQFLWSRGWGVIDTGGGPGRPKPVPFVTSKHHAIMGIVIQAVIEKMYNDEWWRDPATLRDRMLEAVDREWAYQTAKEKNFIDYRVAGTKQSLLQVCRDGVTGYLRTMKKHRLLGEWTKAEYELLGWVDKHNPVGGRADVVFRRADTGVTILDGKNSKSKGKYTDPDQLRWYAMLYYLAFREMPQRLGFVYYRYPHGHPKEDEKGNPILDENGEQQVEDGVDWVEFTKDDLKGLAQRAVKARQGMEKEKFGANPVPSYCKWCDWESVCPDRQAQKEANRRNPKKVEGVGGGGFTDFTL